MTRFTQLSTADRFYFMEIFITRYWSQILIFLLTALAAFQIHGCVLNKALDTAEETRITDVAAQKTASAKECNAANQISEGILNENSSKLSDLERELAAAKRMQHVRTVYVDRPGDLPQSPAQIDGTSNVRSGEGYAVDSFRLYDNAGRSKAEIIEYGSLQQYVRSLKPFIDRCEGRE